MGFGVKVGTGRTYCRLCLMTIEKRQPVIYFAGYSTGGQVHALPEHCSYLTKKLLEMEVIE